MRLTTTTPHRFWMQSSCIHAVLNEWTNKYDTILYITVAINIVIRIYDSFFAAALVCFVWSTIDSHSTINGTCLNGIVYDFSFHCLAWRFWCIDFSYFRSYKIVMNSLPLKTLCWICQQMDRGKMKFGYFCLKLNRFWLNTEQWITAMQLYLNISHPKLKNSINSSALKTLNAINSNGREEN